ncbi:hypothetical protein BCR34DRAFT_135051 [Clohesyomyces aquaticus]|uniref:Uncharacterized protein n=1 Tax=Clohesyomyces aquaticus TaxID=1231657 RepID=A0A1Y2AAI1_9PLEO|nr:hypothetical protein BCR34DRAFT_135051 [Clohesyomyces aquaticus]
MYHTAELLFLTFALFSHRARASVSPSDSASENSIIWHTSSPGGGAIIKLSTPGYPFWLMDKANAPIMEEESGSSYYPQDSISSAVLLEVKLSADEKTLLLNNEAILPLKDPDHPPKLLAYQVPANITDEAILRIKQNGVLDNEWKHLTLAWRQLALDYDRLVWADPDGKGYYFNQPVLHFRILGLGAHKRNDVLDMAEQPTLEVTLYQKSSEENDVEKKSYVLKDIEVKDSEYPNIRPVVEEEKECTLWSWRCPDEGALYVSGRPWYRFIWRERFDQHGRLGSLRHALHRKSAALRAFLNDAGPAMTMSFLLIFVPIVVGLWVYVTVKKWYVLRAVNRVRLLAESDRLLGEEGNDCEGFGEEKAELPPPLPPRPTQVVGESLIDVD